VSASEPRPARPPESRLDRRRVALIIGAGVLGLAIVILLVGNLLGRTSRTTEDPAATGGATGSPTSSLSVGATPPTTPIAISSVAPSPTPRPTAESSTPGAVTVTLRLTLTGPVPADAVFAVQDGVVGGAQHAIYLCSYYGGYAACASGGTYQDALAFPPGTQVSYRFWRELDVNGASEEIEAGELTVGLTDQIVLVTYDFQP